CMPNTACDDVSVVGRWTHITGLSLFDPDVAMLAPGEECLIGVRDRDDGHGWTDPVYTDYWQRIHLYSGRIMAEGTSMKDFGLKHMLRGPAVPWASPWDGGDMSALQKVWKSLVFAREWPVCVSRRYLLATSRVIEVMTGATVFGVRRELPAPSRV